MSRLDVMITWLKRLFAPPTWEFEDIRWMSPAGSDAIITLRCEGALYRFRGGHTVWHEFPDGHRVSREVETLLGAIYRRESWRRKPK